MLDSMDEQDLFAVSQWQLQDASSTEQSIHGEQGNEECQISGHPNSDRNEQPKDELSQQWTTNDPPTQYDTDLMKFILSLHLYKPVTQ